MMTEQIPATVSVEAAGTLLGISRTTAYRLAASGNLPVAVLEVGRKRRVPTALLADALGLRPDEVAKRLGTDHANRGRQVKSASVNSDERLADGGGEAAESGY